MLIDILFSPLIKEVSLAVTIVEYRDCLTAQGAKNK